MATSRKPRYRIFILSRREFVGEPGWHWFRLVAPNGQIMATSELYPTRSNARRAARRFLTVMQRLTVKDIVEV